MMPEISGPEEGSVEESSKPLDDPPTTTIQDAVFGEIIEEGPNYRDVGSFSRTFTRVTNDI